MHWHLIIDSNFFIASAPCFKLTQYLQLHRYRALATERHARPRIPSDTCPNVNEWAGMGCTWDVRFHVG
jgi:hypothetical protein